MEPRIFKISILPTKENEENNLMFTVKVLLTYPLPPNKAHLVSKICNKHPSIKTGKLYTSWRYIKEYLYGNIHISEIH